MGRLTDDHRAAHPAAPPSRAAGAPGSAAVRILLVEDNPDGALLLEEALARETHFESDITHVEGLSDALRHYVEASCEVVLLDLGLADSQGLRTLEVAQEVLPGVPIIVLTGVDDDAVGVAAVQAGAEDYLVKGQEDPRHIVRAIRYSKERHGYVERIQTLNASLKAMLDRRLEELRDAQDKAVRNDRMAAVGTLAAGVAHEINSPLMGVINHLEYALVKLPESQERLRVVLSEAVEYATRCSGIIDSLLTHARESATNPDLRLGAMADVATAVADALGDAREFIEDGGIFADVDIAPNTPPVRLDQGSLRLVLLNLIRNACRAMHGAPVRALVIQTKRVGDELAISVRDSGSGLPPGDVERVFEPLCTTAPGATSIGLGLALCKRLVEGVDGRIVAASSAKRGTVFTFYLAVVGPDAAAAT